ncbi:MAG: Arm DNA-binding domain-containing protein [Allosphingosinicella sp.]
MLTDLKIRQAKARESDYKLPDGGGLHLFVTKRTFKSWRLTYRFC